MTNRYGCQSSGRGKGEVVTKKRNPNKRKSNKKGSVKTKKTNQRVGGGNKIMDGLRKIKNKIPFGKKSKKLQLPIQFSNDSCSDKFVIIIRDASKQSKKDNTSHKYTMEISQKNDETGGVTGTCKYKILKEGKGFSVEIPSKETRDCVKGNKKLHNLINFLAERPDLQTEFQDLDDIETKFSYAINACPTNDYATIGSPLPTIPSLHYNAPKGPQNSPAVYAVPQDVLPSPSTSSPGNKRSSSHEYVYSDLPGKSIISSLPALGSASSRSNPSRRSSASSRDSGIGPSLPTSRRNSTNSTYSDPQDQLKPGANASPPKKSKLDYALEEYEEEVGLKTLYDNTKLVIQFIKKYEFIDNADKIKKKRGEEILNELKKTNVYASEFGLRETPMNFLTGLKTILNGQLKLLQNEKFTDKSERILFINKYLNNILDTVTLQKIINISSLIQELQSLKIRKLTFTDSQFNKQYGSEYKNIPDPGLSFNNDPSLLFLQYIMRIKDLLNAIIKPLNKDNNDNNDDKFIEAINLFTEAFNLAAERTNTFNEIQRKYDSIGDCRKTIFKVLNEGGDIDVKECFDGPEPLITNMKRGWDDNGLCSKLKKKTKGINPLKTKKRNKFKNALKTNCEHNLVKRKVRTKSRSTKPTSLTFLKELKEKIGPSRSPSSF